MKAYLSGPMSGIPEWNYPAFEAAAVALRSKGIEVVSPREVNAEASLDMPWSWYIRRDIAALLDCDTIVLLPGCEKSRGSRLEQRIAEALDFTIISLEAALLWDLP